MSAETISPSDADDLEEGAAPGPGKPVATALLSMAIPLLATLVFVAAVLVKESAKRASNPAGAEVRAEKPPAPKLDLPAFALTTQAGEPFGSDDLADKWWVGGFIFTNCATICPPMTDAMKRLQDSIAGAPMGIQLVFFSVDPDNDTPEVLARYADRHGADPERWKFLTGDREKIYALAKEGFKVGVGEAGEDAPDPIFHSDRFMLMAPGHRFVGYFHGSDPAEMNKLVKELRHIGNDLERRKLSEARPAPQEKAAAAEPEAAAKPKRHLSAAELQAERRRQARENAKR